MFAHSSFTPGAVALIAVGLFTFGLAVGVLIAEYSHRRPG